MSLDFCLRFERRRLSFLLAVPMAFGVVACGGDGASAPSQSAQQEERRVQDKEGRASDGGVPARGGLTNDTSARFTPRRHSDSGGGSQQFRVPGGDNSVQEFGTEAEEGELEAAAAALHNFFDARAQRAWRAACSYLASHVVGSMRQAAAGGEGAQGGSCAEGLRAITNPNTPRLLREEAEQLDVGAVRVEGERGFVLYRVEGARYAIPVALEDGEFKVAALVGYPLG